MDKKITNPNKIKKPKKTKKEKNTLSKSLPSISVENYTKKFKKFTATKNMTFSVGQGVIHGFIGPNGAGKTTTIKAMIGAYRPTEGGITINGNKAGSALANKLIGYIPERASFPKHLNTIEYLIMMAELSGLTSKEAKSKAKEMLDDLGLLDQAKRKPISFSSGMQKKILLAQSLIIKPSVLILDEPAANLDPTARKELFERLIKLRNEGKTILISSHILAELERIIDEVTFVYYGEIIYSGEIEKLTNKENDVFIKTSNNNEVATILKEWDYKVEGDVKTEIVVKNLGVKEIKKLFAKLGEIKQSITSFRANDLQAIYDHLIAKSELEKRGSQTLRGQKVISMKTKKRKQNANI